MTVLDVDVEKTDAEYRHRTWLKCKCSCGNTKSIRRQALNSGKTKSCGCMKGKYVGYSARKDITGQEFGRLTALYPTNLRDTTGAVMWKCKCICGNTTLASTTNLRRGDKRSCGCMASYNEEKIIKLLLKYNIKFKSQFYFSDLVNPSTNKTLKFDFAIFDKQGYLVMLIEFDGVQHFKEARWTSNPQKNKEKFETLKIRDKLKNEYCKKNGFSLFRIPYTYEEDVEKLLLQNLKSKGVI